MQQRYQLLTGLAEKAERHMVFLTATPFSHVRAFQAVMTQQAGRPRFSL
jgi:hypothetical protein